MFILKTEKGVMFIPKTEKGVISIPNQENKGSCLYQNQKIRGHVYTKRVKKVTHVGSTSVITQK